MEKRILAIGIVFALVLSLVSFGVAQPPSSSEEGNSCVVNDLFGLNSPSSSYRNLFNLGLDHDGCTPGGSCSNTGQTCCTQNTRTAWQTTCTGGKWTTKTTCSSDPPTCNGVGPGGVCDR